LAGWECAGRRGGRISGFNKNAKILYFVTKLLQGRQFAHKSVTDFPEICRDFHAEEREFGTQMLTGVGGGLLVSTHGNEELVMMTGLSCGP
jgi:hypothetical protein